MKITRSLSVLVLPLLFGSIAWSAPEKMVSPPVKVAVALFPKDEEANSALATELFTHGLDIYDAAKSFQGAFILTMNKTNGEGKAKKNESMEVRMRTSWRMNEQGNKDRENTLTVISGQEKGKPFVQTIRNIDNGQFSTEYIAEEKVWTQSARKPLSTFRSLMRPIMDSLVSNTLSNPISSLVVEQGVEGGLPTYIVFDKENIGTFRAIYNSSDRSLRSLTIGDPNNGAQITIFDRKFNAPLTDSNFVWKAPKGARQVPVGTIKPKIGMLGN